MACTSSCLTPGSHKSWGQCLRAKNIQIGDLGHGVRKQWDSDLQAYDNARRAGIQPSGLERPAVDRAVRISEAEGTAFDANTYGMVPGV